LTTREQTRLQILNAVLERWWLVREAVEVLGVSERHVWRILAAYRKEGAAALSHGNRGRHPANTTPGGVKQRVVSVMRERYLGINHTHLTELLAERGGIVLSRSNVRRLLVGARLPSSRHRCAPRHRCRRQRMPHEGMLLQLDGSHHAWLEGRGPMLTMLLPQVRFPTPSSETERIPGVTSSCSRASYGGVVYRLRCIPTATPSSSAVTGRRMSPS